MSGAAGLVVDRLVRSWGRISADPTGRELEALRYMSRGLTYAMTADAMGISHESVKQLLERARLRLGAKTTCQACCEAVRRELMP